MSIAVTCPHCGKKFKLADSLGGRKGKCSGCGGVVKIPAAPAPPEPELDLDVYGLDEEAESQAEPEEIAGEPPGNAPLEAGAHIASTTVEECSSSRLVLACGPGRILLFLMIGVAMLIGGFVLATILEGAVERATSPVRILNLFVLIPFGMMGLGAGSFCYLGRLGYRAVCDRGSRSFHTQRLYIFNRDWLADELGGVVFRTSKVGDVDRRGNGTEQTADAFVLDRDGRAVALLERVSSNKPKYIVPLAKAALHAGRLLNLPVYVEQLGPVLRPDMRRAVQLIQGSSPRTTPRAAPKFRAPLLTTYKAATIVMAVVMVVGVSRFMLRYTWLGHKATAAADKFAPGALDVVVADNPLTAPAPEPEPAQPEAARPVDSMEFKLVDQWITEMRSPDESKRRSAAFFLSGRDVLPDRRAEVCEQLRSLNASTDKESRKQAMIGLGRWGTDEDLTTLIGELGNPDRGLREAAGAGLVASKSPRAVEALVARLREPEGRSDVANHLRRFGPGAEPAVAGLLDDPDDAIKLTAASILENIGTRNSVPALQAAIDRAPAPAPEPTPPPAAPDVPKPTGPNPAAVFRETFNRTRDPIAANKAAQAAAEAMFSMPRPNRPDPFGPEAKKARAARELRDTLERAARNAGTREPARLPGS